MIKFRNKGEACSVYAPGGAADSLMVEHGQVCEVRGESAGETADAYLVQVGSQKRAWPKSRWELAQDQPRARGGDKKE